MKNFEDEHIDRMLRVIGGTKASEGLEGRVLQRLAERRTNLAPMIGMSWRLAWVGAAVVVVAIAAVMVHGNHEQGGSGVASEHKAATPFVAPSAVVGSASSKNVARRLPALRVGSRKSDGWAPDAVEKVRSYAAPEAPLTHEERLLIRIAQRADAVEIAALDPKVWAMRDAEEKVAVAAFFVRPKPKVDGNGPLEVITAHSKSNASIESDDGGDESSDHPAENK